MRAHAISNTILALLAFSGVSRFVRELVPGPASVASTPKLEYLKEHAGDYDAIFLGSSRVYRHFVPSVIDERLGKLGEPLRTFNLGTPGAGSFEVDSLLRTVLAMEGVRLRFVFIEPSSWSPSIFYANRETERTIAWHTLTGTSQAVEASWKMNADLRVRLETGMMHLRLFGWHLSNLGLGKRITRSLMGIASTQPISVADVGKAAGYWPLDFEYTERLVQRRLRLLDDRMGFELKVSRLPYRGSLNGARSRRGADLIKRQIQLVRSAGAEPVYVIPPGTVGTPLLYSQRKFGQLNVLLAFNDPAKYPSYYDYDLFYDRNHLKSKGAKIFSRIFAEEFVSWLRGGKPKSFVEEDF